MDWQNFKGSSNSKNLKNVDLVKIITRIMIYAGYDPATHIEVANDNVVEENMVVIEPENYNN